MRLHIPSQTYFMVSWPHRSLAVQLKSLSTQLELRFLFLGSFILTTLESIGTALAPQETAVALPPHLQANKWVSPSSSESILVISKLHHSPAFLFSPAWRDLGRNITEILPAISVVSQYETWIPANVIIGAKQTLRAVGGGGGGVYIFCG